MISADKDCYMVEMPKEAAWGGYETSGLPDIGDKGFLCRLYAGSCI